jgi:hypothetical protein
MNVEIGAEAVLFPEKEHINGIAVAVCAVSLLLPDIQLRSYTIPVWSYETFIVIETVIDRYLAVKTQEGLNKLIIMIFIQTR